jgi:hypothetical protein
MFNRLWAFLLILICGFNAIGLRGSAYLSEREHESISLVSHTDSILVAPSSDTDGIASAAHFPGDGHEGDCGTQQKAHTCHLGHCTFLMTSVSGLVAPDLVLAVRNHSNFSFLSADLSGPNKPPRA